MAKPQPVGIGHRTCPDSFFCSLHLVFLNGLPDKDFFNIHLYGDKRPAKYPLVQIKIGMAAVDLNDSE